MRIIDLKKRRIPNISSNGPFVATKLKILKSTLGVTVFALCTQAILFGSQIIMASFFGAGARLDAYLAVAALPQYVTTVLLGSLGFVFLPIFVDLKNSVSDEDAWHVASSVINFTVLVLVLMTIMCLVLSRDFIRILAPGLPASSSNITITLALLIWPTMIGQGLVALLTNVYHAKSQFIWPAAVPLMGAVITLVLLLLLVRGYGIIGLAIATTAGVIFQASFLIPIAVKSGHYRFVLDFHHPGVRRVLMLVLPLIVASIVGKATTVVERHLASSMIEGSISHLGYAFRLITIPTLLISIGIPTVAFPKMALSVSQNNQAELWETILLGSRYMWMAVAVVMAIGVGIAKPLVVVVFQRGEFSSSDSIVVAQLFQVYLLSLPSACLANITARAFYVMKDTRTVALYGTIESVAYVFYTFYLARKFGIVGIVLGYTILFSGSLLWQVVILYYRMGKSNKKNHMPLFFVKTTAAALVSCIVVFGGGYMFENIYMQFLIGSVAGFVTYIILLSVLGIQEIKQIGRFTSQLLASSWDSFRGKSDSA